MSNAAINKNFAISHHRSAIVNAEALLAVEGMEAAYYDWHRKTIATNNSLIGDIKAAPETQWN